MVKAEVYAFVADGTEETELLCPVDILRRAGIETAVVSVSGRTVTGSHGVSINADATIDEVDLSAAALLLLPGGMPGTKTLAACAPLMTAVKTQLKSGKRVAAICAAPALCLGANGLLDGKMAICFPGFEDRMTGCDIQKNARVVTDGNITTARGMGCAVDFGLELVGLLSGAAAAESVKAKIQY